MGKRAKASGGGVILPVRYRRYAYSVMLAAAPVAVAYGIITTEQAGLWLSLTGAVLGVGSSLALLNTDKGENANQ